MRENVRPADAAMLREAALLYDHDGMQAEIEQGRDDEFCVRCYTIRDRLRALADAFEKLDALTVGDWPYLAALADAQRWNGDGAQYFTSSHMRIVDRMTAVLAALRSAAATPVGEGRG